MITRAADYALRATLALAGLPPGARLSELAGECDVPPAFLYKVLRMLANHGLLAPHRGITGGYELTARAWEATVLDVVEAVDGLPLLNTCVLTGACHRSPACPAPPIWIEAQARVREVLAGARVADLARSTPDAAPLPGLPSPLPHLRGARHERVRLGHDSRRPAADGRRPRGTHPKRMVDR
jgi:Rrf2 family protein